MSKGASLAPQEIRIDFAVLPLAAAGTEARFTVPFDGTPEIVGKPGEKLPEARIFGRTGYVDGVSGKALSVRRHAYDQVTAVNISGLPVLSCTEGSVAFRFRPNPDDKGDGNNWLYFARSGGKIQSYLIYFRDKGMFELTVCAPRQRQLFAKVKLDPAKWYHLAFTWNAAKGEVAFYVNGKAAAGKQRDAWIAPDFKLSDPLNIWLGRGGSDRFQAKVGEGDYDEIKLYDRQLSPDEILTESIGGAAMRLSPVPAEKVARNGKRIEVRFSAPGSRFSSAQPLMEFRSAGGEIRISSLGSSGKLTINGGVKNLESPYVFNHKLPLNIAVEAEGKQAKIFFDGVPQGSLELSKPWGNSRGGSCSGIEISLRRSGRTWNSRSETQKFFRAGEKTLESERRLEADRGRTGAHLSERNLADFPRRKLHVRTLCRRQTALQSGSGQLPFHAFPALRGKGGRAFRASDGGNRQESDRRMVSAHIFRSGGVEGKAHLPS